MLRREVIGTEDGSATLFVPELNEHYHSVHGAVQESLHVYIGAGLEYFGGKEVHVLEAGFGTGLNAYLSLCYAAEQGVVVHYHSFEKYPLSPTEVGLLNYAEGERRELFGRLHECVWEEECEITPCFYLHKHLGDFSTVDFDGVFEVVFFDAFNPDVQPHLWTEDILGRFCRALKPGGVFVTYCVKGVVKQRLRSLGMSLKRLPGPPGKREMLRGVK